VDALTGRERVVFLEPKLRDDLEPDLTTQLMPEVRRRGTQRRPRTRLGGLIAERREGDPGDPEIAGDLDAGDRDEPDPRVLQLVDRFGEDLSEPLADPLRSRSLQHGTSVPGVPQSSGQISWSSASSTSVPSHASRSEERRVGIECSPP